MGFHEASFEARTTRPALGDSSEVVELAEPARVKEESQLYDSADTRQVGQMLPDLLRVYGIECPDQAQAMVADFVYMVQEANPDFRPNTVAIMEEMSNFFPESEAAKTQSMGVIALSGMTKSFPN